MMSRTTQSSKSTIIGCTMFMKIANNQGGIQDAHTKSWGTVRGQVGV